ncbi:MAG: hypothetical protein ACI85K_002086 [Hyphomicrobiaceae bacterium]
MHRTLAIKELLSARQAGAFGRAANTLYLNTSSICCSRSTRMIGMTSHRAITIRM